MPELTTIVRKDFHKLNTVVQSGLKGAMHGLYTPFLIRTGVNHYKSAKSKSLDQYTGHGRTFLDKVGEDRLVAESLGQLLVAYTSFSSYLFLAMSQGFFREYVATVVATNVLDYGIGVYRRSKYSDVRRSKYYDAAKKVINFAAFKKPNK